MEIVQTRLSEGSVVMIDAGQAFIVMKKGNGFTIAEVDATGVEAKDVYFATLHEMEAWFDDCESKIARVLSYKDFLFQLHELAESMVKTEPVEDDSSGRTVEDLRLSVRTYNCLKRAGINTERQIRQLSYDQITKIRNLSRKSLLEIEQALNIKFE